MAKKPEKPDPLKLIKAYSGPPASTAFWSTGFYALNYLITRRPNGGFPRGMLSTMWGTDGGGKTTVALSTIGLASEQGARIMYIDSESRVDPGWANRFGVTFVASYKDWKPGTTLVFSSKDKNLLSVESALDLMEAIIEPGSPYRPDIIVIDSIYNLLSQAKIEATASDQHMANEARAWSARLPIIAQKCAIADTAIIGINQATESIGGMVKGYVFPRGQRWKFQSSVRMRLRYNSNVKPIKPDIPRFVASMEKSSVGGLKKAETQFQLRPKLPYPIDTAYDLVMTGRDAGLFVKATGEPHSGSGGMYLELDISTVEIGGTIAAATKTLAEKPELAQQIMDIFDTWDPARSTPELESESADEEDFEFDDEFVIEEE